MRTIAIMNLKGGTAKTVTAINLAAALSSNHRQRVLLVDADSQANLTEFVTRGLPDGVTPGGFPDLLRGLDAFPMPTKLDNVHLLHADESLMALDVSAVSSGQADLFALANFLQEKEIAGRFDYCVIDCPPAFSAGAMAALCAAYEVVIPMKLDAFGIRGMANLIEQIRNMRRINPDLEVAGVLPTMVWSRDPSQKQALEDLRASLLRANIRCFHYIHLSPRTNESTFKQEPLIFLSPKSAAARDYKIFTRDLTAAEGGEL